MTARSVLARLAPSAHPPARWPVFAAVDEVHLRALVARLGRALGTCFAICFVTGLASHYQYHPWSWLPEPARPAWGYRFTQGLHVTTGIATIPLLLAKLWSVYPRLFAWPPVRGLAHGLERASVAVLVSASLVELATGLLNVLQWYPWPWDFVFVHRQLAYVAIGSLLLHVAVKLPLVREGLATPLRTTTPVRDGTTADAPGLRSRGIGRRGVLAAAAAGATTVAVTVVGQTLTPLRRLALLAPREPDRGPSGVPVNRTAADAGVAAGATAASWRLSVLGPRPFDLELAEVERLATTERSIPLACVEGWSVGADWRGIPLLDLVRRAGGDATSRVLMSSLEASGAYRSSVVDGPQLSQALLATHLGGDRLTLDHGYPLRLIVPDRAGVLNTKWLTRIEVLG